MDHLVRPYQQAWEDLKKSDKLGHPYLSLDLDKSLHLTLLNGLRRESARDTTFRFLCAEKGRSFSIGYNQIGNLLQVYLKWKNYITPSFVKPKAKKKS